jgi:glycosyltransferase involved in cell wall biosynthesis
MVEALRCSEGSLSRSADHIVVTTASLAGEVRDAAGKEFEGEIDVVPNYVDCDVFRPSDLVEDLEKELTVVSVGRLSAEKNYRELIEAVASLAGVRLEICGTGPDRDALQALATELQVELLLPGRVPQSSVAELLRRAVVYVQCSLSEGHPKGVLEAMASGLAVVVPRRPGFADCIEDGHTGLVYEGGSSGLRRCIVQLMENPELRRTLGWNARKWALARVDLGRVAELEYQAMEVAATKTRRTRRGERWTRDRKILSQLRWTFRRSFSLARKASS